MTLMPAIGTLHLKEVVVRMPACMSRAPVPSWHSLKPSDVCLAAGVTAWGSHLLLEELNAVSSVLGARHASG